MVVEGLVEFVWEAIGWTFEAVIEAWSAGGFDRNDGPEPVAAAEYEQRPLPVVPKDPN